MNAPCEILLTGFIFWNSKVIFCSSILATIFKKEKGNIFLQLLQPVKTFYLFLTKNPPIGAFPYWGECSAENWIRRSLKTYKGKKLATREEIKTQGLAGIILNGVIWGDYFCLNFRKSYYKFCSLPFFAFHSDRTTKRFHNFFHKRQSQTPSVRIDLLCFLRCLLFNNLGLPILNF